MDLLDLFKKETKIPSLPEVFYRFKEAVENPDVSFDELGEVVAADLGLTARLLKIVNSPYYGFSNQIETIPHAISIIGNRQLSDLVLSTCIIDRFEDVPSKAMDMQLFWEHSIACGLTAKIMANHLKMIDPNSIFVAGLLHDIGRLVICLNSPAIFSEVFLKAQLEDTSLLEVENKIMGFGHDQAGEELLRRWKLPKIHQETVRYHHSPIEAPLFDKEASIINIANDIAKSLALGSSGDLSESKPNEGAMKILGIKNEDFLLSVIEETKEKYQNTIEAFLKVTR